MRRSLSIIGVLIGAAGACGGAHGQQPTLEPDNGPWIMDVQGGQIRVVSIAQGLVHPWSLAFLPDGDLLVAESNGRVRLVHDDELRPEPVWTAPGTADGGGELKSIAVHPQFEDNRWVYLAHPKDGGERGNTLAISRGRFEGGKLEGVEEIFVADAWETGGNLGGRILFGPDSTLYITLGDRDRLCCIGRDDPSLRLKAQDLDNHVGKTLRIRDDGGVPVAPSFDHQRDPYCDRVVARGLPF